MYYFWGAGGNCPRAIEFWGAENIISIVDIRANTKDRGNISGIPIVTVEEFRESYNGEMVIITSNLHSEEIKMQLNEMCIDNYYVCPVMSYDFISVEEIIKRSNVTKYDKVVLQSKNAIHNCLDDKLKTLEIGQKVIWDIPYENNDSILYFYDNADEIKDNTNVFSILDEDISWKREQTLGLKKYHNFHKGGKAFIIGNGPSLRPEDLEKLHENNITSFGANSIKKVFEYTNWRPNYIMWGDALAYYRDEAPFFDGITYFLNLEFKVEDSKYSVEHYYGIVENYYPGYPSFSENICEGIYGGRSTLYTIIQILVYMGCSEIYLLGQDFSWGEDGRGTHFYPENDPNFEQTVRDAIRNKDQIIHACEKAKEYTESHGCKIYNATRGGYLEVFDRVDFDELMENWE